MLAKRASSIAPLTASAFVSRPARRYRIAPQGRNSTVQGPGARWDYCCPTIAQCFQVAHGQPRYRLRCVEESREWCQRHLAAPDLAGIARRPRGQTAGCAADHQERTATRLAHSLSLCRSADRECGGAPTLQSRRSSLGVSCLVPRMRRSLPAGDRTTPRSTPPARTGRVRSTRKTRPESAERGVPGSVPQGFS